MTIVVSIHVNEINEFPLQKTQVKFDMLKL